MAGSQTISIVDTDGARGILEDPSSLSQPGDTKVAVRLENGKRVWISRQLLSLRKDGSYKVPFALKELEVHNRSLEEPDALTTIPVAREELSVEKRLIETGRARIHKTVVERQETVDEPLEREEVIVERVLVNQILCEPAPTVRQEGDTLIIPLLEEVLVVEKRIMLREEVHIRRKKTTFHNPQQVTLRSEEVSVDRVSPPAANENDPSSQENSETQQQRNTNRKKRPSGHGRAQP